jgi:hypothetical protein
MASGEDIAKRRAVVKSNPRLRAKELCEIFDLRQIPRNETLQVWRGQSELPML